MIQGNVQNTAELRSLNRKKIFECLRGQAAMTKKDIAAATSLSVSTVSSLCNQMEEEGLLQYQAHAAPSGGRAAKMLALHARSRYILAVNLVMTDGLYMALTDLLGVCAAEWTAQPEHDGDYEALLALMAAGLQALLEQAGVSRARVLGAGVAVPGIFDRQNGLIVNSTVPLLENRRLQNDLETLLALPVYLENESNLMALAALQADAAQDLLLLYVGEGLGAGVIEHGDLLSGAHGYGGEIGHMPLGRAGYACYCGERNCVETEVAIGGFVRKYNEGAERPISHALSVPAQWRQFVRLVEAGDARAVAVAEENAKLLGTLAAVLVNLLDSQEVIVGGYVADIADVIAPVMRKEAARKLVVPRRDRWTLRFEQDYRRLIMAGCGELALARWFP